MGRVFNMFDMRRPIDAAALWDGCLIYLHGPTYGCSRPSGRVPNTFGMGRPMVVAAHGRVINMFGICRTPSC